MAKKAAEKAKTTRVEPRLSTDEILDSMFSINPAKEVMKETKDEVSYYTNNGVHGKKINGIYRVDKDGPNALAKEQSGKYYIKANGGKLFNPKGVFSDYERAQKLYGKQSVWKWLKVNKKVFDLYLKFLKTGNELHLKGAEQQIV